MAPQSARLAPGDDAARPATVSREALDQQRRSRRFAREEARAEISRAAERLARKEVAADSADFIGAAAATVTVLTIAAVALQTRIANGGEFDFAFLERMIAPLAPFGGALLGLAALALCASLIVRGVGLPGGGRSLAEARLDFSAQLNDFYNDTRKQGRDLSQSLEDGIKRMSAAGPTAALETERLGLMWLAYKDYFDATETIRGSFNSQEDQRGSSELGLAGGAFAFGLVVGLIGASLFGGVDAAPSSAVVIGVAAVLLGVVMVQGGGMALRARYRHSLTQLQHDYQSKMGSLQLTGPAYLSKQINEQIGSLGSHSDG
ncbi:MAG: hypothetical protein AAF869_00830 [Pseudomonadota bacterium]